MSPLPLVSLLFLGALWGASAQTTSPRVSLSGQLGVPISWIEDPVDSDLRYMGQKSRDGRLFLGPNECFFPEMGLVAMGKGKVPDMDGLNKGSSFESIGKWGEGDVAEWGIWLPQPGK